MQCKNGVHSASWSDKLSSYLNKEVTVRSGKLKMQLWVSMCWPHVYPVPSGAVGKDCQRRLLSRPRFVRAVAPRIFIQLSQFPVSWKEVKAITLPKAGKDPKFPQNLRPISLLSITGKLFEKVILKIIQRNLEERDLLNARQFGFRARHSTTLQCMRLTDHVTLNFNNNMCTAAVFLDIEKSFDTTWPAI
jgi:hypothetical protein